MPVVYKIHRTYGTNSVISNRQLGTHFVRTRRYIPTKTNILEYNILDNASDMFVFQLVSGIIFFIEFVNFLQVIMLKKEKIYLHNTRFIVIIVLVFNFQAIISLLVSFDVSSTTKVYDVHRLH